MPFEGINFGLARPTVALESPMDAAMKALALQNQKQQIQQGAMNLEKGGIDLQQQKQEVADQQRIRDLAQSQSFKSLGDLADAAEKAGVSPKTVSSMRQQHILHQKEVAQLTETLGKVDAQRRAQMQAAKEALGKATLTADTPEKFKAGLASVAQEFPEMTPKLQEYAANVNPANLEQIKTDVKWNGLKLDDALAEIRKKEEYSGFHPGADQTAYQVNGKGQARQVVGPDGKPLRVPPPQTAITMQQMNSTYDGSTPLNPGLEAIAKGIAKGDQEMLVSARSMPKFADINARAAFIRDSAGQGDLLGKSQVQARASSLKDFETGGKSGQTISALNTMTEHLNTAARLSQALQNGDVQLVNKIRQEFQKQTGSPAPTDFGTLKQFLAGEVAKVATGGHLTEGEIKNAADRLNAAQSPAQLAGVLSTMQEVAGGKLVALNQDYKRIKGKTLAEDGRLTPATEKAFKTAQQHIEGGTTRTVTNAQLKQIADQTGKSLDQVTKDALAKGWRVQ